MQETLSKLKEENSSLKIELNKKQIINSDTEMMQYTQFDKEKY